MSKFADNLEDLAERTAEYIRVIEEGNKMLREEKNYLLHKAGENIAEIAKLQEQRNSLLDALEDIISEFGICGLTENARRVVAKVTGETK